MEEADIMVDIVQKHGVKFNYGTQRRYMPIYRKFVNSSTLAKSAMSNAPSPNTEPVLPSGLNSRRRHAPLPRG